MIVTFFSFLFVFIFSVFSFAEANVLSIHNEFIKAVVNNNDAKGRFALETTLGNPDNSQDDYQDLIYGKPIPWTSYTTLLIDNNPYIFGDSDKRLKHRTKTNFNYAPLSEQFVSNNIITSTAFIKDFNISQNIGFYRNPNTNIHDSIFIEYHVTNTSPDTHYFGLRIMLDTKLGQNDGAPFRMGRDQIESEIQLTKKDLFAYWQAFDSLTTPNIISQGLLTDSSRSLTMPDVIHLANWGTLVDQPWNAPYKQERSFVRKGEDQKDTALALTFQSKAIQPNQTKIFKTVYGLGGIAISSGELSLGLTAPKSLLQTHDSPILIIAYLLNTGGYDAYNVEVSFNLPKSISIIKGNDHEVFSILQKGQQLQFPLLVKVNDMSSSTIPISFSVKSSTFDSNAITHAIKILEPPKLSVSIPNKIMVSAVSPYITITPIIQNSTSIPIKDISVFLSDIPEAAFPPFEYAAKVISTLPPFSSKSLSWSLNTSTLRLPFSFKISAISNHAINSTKKILFHQAPYKRAPSLSVYSTSNITPPYYLTLKVMNISSNPNHYFSLKHPKKSAIFVDYSSSNQLVVPMTYKQSLGELTFSPADLQDDYLYLHYHILDDTNLSFVLSKHIIQTSNESEELVISRSIVQTLDLTMPSKNAIVSANQIKE
ncbi:hypothetical protein DID74_01690 [Candidatus Marinamargulisbacteria bacterium SCGC AG-333-B06]|nr:hypothetical protein DID74_01690 [Candidatus Marinamargulisbacteria bacterium SCGC AG-333-B06]